MSLSRNFGCALLLGMLFPLALAAQPAITSFTPASGQPGTTLTINGLGFNADISKNTVFIGTIKATILSNSATQLVVEIPLGVSSGLINIKSDALQCTSAEPFFTGFQVHSPLESDSIFRMNDQMTAVYQTSFAYLADLNNDNRPELISTAGSIQIYRNTSSPDNIEFEPFISLVTQNNTRLGSITDIDGDGKPDILYTNSPYNTFSLNRNLTTGVLMSFDTRMIFSTNVSPSSLVTPDLDNDGKPDVVVSNYTSNNLSVFRNTSSPGAVSFAAKTDHAVVATPGEISYADFDRDGKTDLSVLNLSNGSFSVFRNTSTTGAISFATRMDIALPNLVLNNYTCDLDGDGFSDLIFCDYDAGQVKIMRNTSTAGNISFATPVIIPLNSKPSRIAFADINSDSRFDMLVARYDSSYTILENTGSSGNISFTSKGNHAVAPDLRAITCGDIDKDGKPDLVVASNTNSRAYAFRNILGEKLATCDNGNVLITTTPKGNSYQWQWNYGMGYVNLLGETNDTLLLNNITSNGNLYRCLVNGYPTNGHSVSVVNKWIGSASQEWENPANWSCGQLPGPGTQVQINGGILHINSHPTIKSLRLMNNASVTVRSGYTLNILN